MLVSCKCACGRILQGYPNTNIKCPVCGRTTSTGATKAEAKPTDSDLSSIRWKCPWCQAKLRANAVSAGKGMKCPSCQRAVKVPGPLPRTDAASETGKNVDDGILPELAAKLRRGPLVPSVIRELVDKGAEGVPTLIDALSSENPGTRGAAIKALVQNRDPRSVPAILPLLLDVDGHVRHIAAAALGDLGWQPKEPIHRIWRHIALEEYSQAAKMGQQALEPLVSVLFDQFDKLNKEAGRAMLQCGGDRAIDVLSQRIRRSKSEEYDTTLLLCEADNPRAIPVLEHVLTNGSWVGRLEPTVFQAIVRLCGAGATDWVIKALGHRNSHIPPLAATYLGDHGVNRAILPLVLLLEAQSWHSRATAVTALGKMTEATVINPLVKILDDPESQVRWRGAESLGSVLIRMAARIPDHDLMVVIHRLQALLEDSDYDVRKSCASSLAGILAVMASRFSAMDLGKLAAVDYPIVTALIAQVDTGHGDTRAEIVKGVDCSKINRLAQQELKRRGL